MGMMSGCYFIGRSELLQWLNDLLSLNYDKVEDTSSGAAFCQVIDCIHPGTVSLGKVNFNAHTEPEYINNYKILQEAFDKNGIKQYIDVDTLTKGKYMAALELFQWIHGYYEQTGPHDDYDAVARRRQARCKEPVPKGKASITTHKSTSRVVSQKTPSAAQKRKVISNATPSMKPTKQNTSLSAPNFAASKEIKSLNKRIQELEEENDQVTQERDFYYDKLRRVEDYCQDNEGTPNIQEILEILYETDESKGFLPQEEEDF